MPMLISPLAPLTALGYLSFTSFAIWLLVSGLIILVLYRTAYYALAEDTFRYWCNLTKGSIELGSIRFIELKTKRPWGIPAAAHTNHGYVIHYNKWDQLFISPENPEAFLNEFLKRNPNIKVIATAKA